MRKHLPHSKARFGAARITDPRIRRLYKRIYWLLAKYLYIK